MDIGVKRGKQEIRARNANKPWRNRVRNLTWFERKKINIPTLLYTLPADDKINSLI